ncbi:hypothetical protein [Pleionea sp. CnH1-48]|uniref:hypothetical protein n=1 Tax=Pleionea sp. CnH1-48 TaxID=2954494 RepID=UPI0020974285|nr:hypothetical protein [Pleionea sp. CnH1-48]MCO7223190.1 hypothetical protein [Pleionea sp. CnH1-48]
MWSVTWLINLLFIVGASAEPEKPHQTEVKPIDPPVERILRCREAPKCYDYPAH